ncbi:protein FAM149B1-like isoform X2 [Periplaneta americana]|uniref:protein FAM149B1-like isoform X2 n=1 Tax=Periplaneta americana TaxID=6978 RepID=UPI0037E971CF
MSLKPTRRNLSDVQKVKLRDHQPLPEPAEDMAIEIQEPPIPAYSDRHKALKMLSSLALDDADSRNSTPYSREESFDEDFGFDSADDSDQGRSWQLSGDIGSSSFGNSVASFMSWTDDVEVETTKKVQELVDELEKCLYDEESLDKLKKEVAAECYDWRTKFPHYRVRGTGIPSSSFQLQRMYESTISDQIFTSDNEASCVVLEAVGQGDDEEEEMVEEIIASHGSYAQNSKLDDWCNKCDVLESISDSSRPSTADQDGDVCYGRQDDLKQKVKEAVMEQLFSHVWSEMSKSIEPLLKLSSERTLQQKSGYVSFPRPPSRTGSAKFPLAVSIPRAFTPISDLDTTLHVSAKSIHCPSRKTSARPSVESNFELDELVIPRFNKIEHSVDPMRNLVLPPTLRLPQPLSLHSATHVLAPIPTLESRGYHSAADRSRRTMLNRRFSSVASGQERFLKPLEEQQSVITKTSLSKTTTPRQVSAPSSPPNWSRHVTLPPIDHFDPSFKLQGISSSFEPTNKSTEFSPRCNSSAKHKISLSPINVPNSIKVEGTGLTKLELAKQLLAVQGDILFEKNGISSSAKEGRGKQKSRIHSLAK